MKRLAILFVSACLVSGGVAQAATYHVSTSGNDGNSCAQARSDTAPKGTIAAALSGITK